MKTHRVVILLFAVALRCFGQGVVLFANYYASGVLSAPVTNAAGNLITGPPYVAHFFWSSNTQATADNLEPAGNDGEFSTFKGGGYFGGGSITLPVWEQLIAAQVRVWDTNYGSTFYEARDGGGEFGASNLILIAPSVPPADSTPLIGLQSFQLQRLPYLTNTLTATNTMVFSWPTEQTSYAVQQNPDLSPTNWTTLPNMPVTVGPEQQVILPVPPTGRMFYRLVSQ